MLSQALQIVFELQSQRKKSTKENTFFKIAKHVFFHFSSFWLLLLHQCITFSFFVQIERFKLLWNRHLKIYKSYCNFLSNRIICKDFLRGFGNRLWVVWSRFIFVKTSPPTSGGHNFLAFSPFLPIFSVTDAPRGKLHLFFGHHEKWGPPTKTVNKPYLKCLDTGLPTLPWISTMESPILKNMLQFCS